MKYLFIDTNIWLSLYHFTNDDLSQFEKLKDMLGDSIKLILPQQVHDEIARNREAKILDALKNLEMKAPQFPAFCKGYKEFLELREDISLAVKKVKDFKEKILSQALTQELPADITIQSFFEMIETFPCDAYINKAYNRYRVGNPPGKDNKYGDAINWECLLDVVPNKENLYFISADKDYRSQISDKAMNPFLVEEWEWTKESKIIFYSRLTDFLKDHAEEIQLETENKKQALIEALGSSGNFVTTHALIAQLNEHSGWTEQQIEQLCNTARNNSQVKWIFEDPDIYNFYRSILLITNHRQNMGDSTKIVCQWINEIEQKKEGFGAEQSNEDFEAEQNDVLEEYYMH